MLLGGLGLGAGAVVGGLSGCGAASPTFESLITGKPFYVAHRGGGGDWPEMTAFAYEQASRLPGLQALEISVCLSRDGVLVCSHDPNTQRATGADYIIAEQPWSVLAPLLVSAAGTIEPEQPARPLSRFDEVSGYAKDMVLFVEPKVKEADGPLLDALIALRQPERVVWKSFINATTFATAKAAGFSTWAYVLDEPSHLGANLERYAADPSIDMLGVGVGEPEEMIGSVVDAARRNGKQTMAWPVKTDQDAAKAVALGCTGLMTSRIRELLPQGR